MSPQQIAPLVGMSANSTAALAYRAREGLRQAWIRAHLQARQRTRLPLDHRPARHLHARQAACRATPRSSRRTSTTAPGARSWRPRPARSARDSPSCCCRWPLASAARPRIPAWLSQGAPVVDYAMGAAGVGAAAGAASGAGVGHATTAGVAGSAAASAGAARARGAGRGFGRRRRHGGTGIAIGAGAAAPSPRRGRRGGHHACPAWSTSSRRRQPAPTASQSRVERRGARGRSAGSPDARLPVADASTCPRAEPRAVEPDAVARARGACTGRPERRLPPTPHPHAVADAATRAEPSDTARSAPVGLVDPTPPEALVAADPRRHGRARRDRHASPRPAVVDDRGRVIRRLLDRGGPASRPADTDLAVSQVDIGRQRRRRPRPVDVDLAGARRSCTRRRVDARRPIITLDGA